MEGVLVVGKVDAQPYNWPHDAPMDSKTTALVIIDMQNDCMYNLRCSIVLLRFGVSSGYLSMIWPSSESSVLGMNICAKKSAHQKFAKH